MLSEAMPHSGSLILSDLTTERLEVACPKCARRGSDVVAALIMRLGPDGRLTDLLTELTWDRPRRGAQAMRDQCEAQFPDRRLGRLWQCRSPYFGHAMDPKTCPGAPPATARLR
jgi:hypothetical protein